MAVNGKCLIRVTADFECSWDSANQYLAIRRSTFGVSLDGANVPLYRYDFIADGNGKVPVAQLNVHAHRDEMVHAMVMAARQHRGKSRDVALERGKITHMADFHFPLGGHRFRPSLEDVLEGVVREFGADTKRGWEKAIARGRLAWREMQLKAAVRDNPAAAATMLEALGYRVDEPAGGGPRMRDERVLAW